MLVRTATLAAIVSILSTSALDAQAPTAEQLVAAAGRYVAEVVARFSNVVAEERMVQRSALDRRTQTLRSDLLLVREPGTDNYMTFRDVLEVNGKTVPDREERLTQLFLQPFRNAVGRARRIEADGARYNLPGMENLNDPFMGLSFLQTRYAWRFSWTLDERDPRVGADAWAVRFLERERPTILGGNVSPNVAARGVVWIDRATGRVLQTETRFRFLRRVVFNGGAFTAGQPTAVDSLGADDWIVVRFRFNEEFGVNVPVEMEEWHSSGPEQVTATATYGRFRKFQVRTEEHIPVVP